MRSRSSSPPILSLFLPLYNVHSSPSHPSTLAFRDTVPAARARPHAVIHPDPFVLSPYFVTFFAIPPLPPISSCSPRPHPRRRLRPSSLITPLFFRSLPLHFTLYSRRPLTPRPSCLLFRIIRHVTRTASLSSSLSSSVISSFPIPPPLCRLSSFVFSFLIFLTCYHPFVVFLVNLPSYFPPSLPLSSFVFILRSFLNALTDTTSTSSILPATTPDYPP
ncbi:hypothetical protein DFH06DRAFT_52955 [Mycena polygramma]|nr:hypothetical protein DFH06DRAFT_52955 [Mycena polygramma]